MIRVLRLIEYTYDTPERMSEDMVHWKSQAGGGGRATDRIIIPPTVVDELEEPQARDPFVRVELFNANGTELQRFDANPHGWTQVDLNRNATQVRVLVQP